MTRNKGCSQTLYASASIWSNYGMWVTPSPRKAIWLFPLPFSRSKPRDASLGNICCPQSPAVSRGHQRLSCCCRCALSVSRTGSSGGRFLHRQGIGNVLPGGSRKVQPPKSSPQCQSHPLATVIPKRKPSAAHTTGLS